MFPVTSKLPPIVAFPFTTKPKAPVPLSVTPSMFALDVILPALVITPCDSILPATILPVTVKLSGDISESTTKLA